MENCQKLESEMSNLTPFGLFLYLEYFPNLEFDPVHRMSLPLKFKEGTKNPFLGLFPEQRTPPTHPKVYNFDGKLTGFPPKKNHEKIICLK